MSKNDRFKEKLSGINDGVKIENKKEVIQKIIHQEEETPDFSKIAEELAQRHEEEKHSLNDGYQKMTIYVEENIAKAFNALCVKRGDQKQFINEALAEYVSKKYKEISAERQ